MSDAIMKLVQQSQLKTDLPVLSIGDTIEVHYRIIEGAKERIQVFSGVIIAKNNRGVEETITVRRIVANEGVERVFPIHSPKIAKIEIKRHSHVRRSKLYFLRDRVGKSRRLPDRRHGLNWLKRAQSGETQTPAQKPETAEASSETETEKASA